MLLYLTEFLVIFTILTVTQYLMPAGFFYWLFHKRPSPPQNAKKIQKGSASFLDIRREIRLSVISLVIFSFFTWLLLQHFKQGGTRLYFDVEEYPLYYLPLSFFLCFFLHDTYFYWFHRFMHWPKVFKLFHLGHHKSRTPTPWAILAFQPLEAVIQFGIFAGIILFLPIHPIVFGLYVFVDSLANTAGHNGYELVPKWFAKNPILKFGNMVEHHDLHHVDFTKNFGAFFNIWDRIMGTYREK